MTQLYHNATGNLTKDLDDSEMYDYLDSNEYEFDEEEVPIHIADPEKPEGLGQIRLMGREDARQYVLNGWGTYKDPEALDHWLNKYDYQDYEGTAAALGAAGALSFGVIPGAMGLMDEKYARIMDANPGYMMASDILTTIAAIALAPETGLASTAALGGPASRLGLKTLIKQAKKAPFRSLTAPNIARQLGGEAEERVGKWLLKDAAQDQLEKSAWRGILPRAAGLGTEALMYSAGYGLPQAIDDKLDGRSWGDVATSYGLQMGMGTALGIAIPGVLHGVGGVGLKTFEGIRKAGAYPVKLMMDSVLAKDIARTIAKGGAAMNPDTMFADPQKAISIAERFTTAHLKKSAARQMAKFSSQVEKMVKKTADFLKDALENQKLINAADQTGHALVVVKKWISAAPADADGAANPFVLADQMLNGNFASKETGVSTGFLGNLREQTQRLLAKAEGEYTPLDLTKTGTRVRHQAATELEAIIEDINVIENTILDWVRRIPLVGRLSQGGAATIDQAHIAFQRWLNEPTQAGALSQLHEWSKRYGQSTGNMKPEQLFVLAHLALDDWKFSADFVNSSTGKLSQGSVDFISDVFVKLERLSARVHSSVTDGPIQPDSFTEAWADSVKDQLTEVLSNTGKTWSVGGVGPTAFGHMAKKKAYINSLLRARGEQHKRLIDKFAVSVEDFPDANRIDFGKVEGMLRGINHSDKDHAANVLYRYSAKNLEIYKYLKDNFDLGGLRQQVIDAVPTARNARDSTKHHIDLMKNEMKDALEWAAIMNADNKLALSAGNRSIMPWSIGAGAAFGLGASAMGLDPETSIAIGVAAGGGKYMYDGMVSPGRAMANINKFFIAGNEFDEFITGQVNRYFTWLNKAGKYPRQPRLAYVGPGDDGKIGRYSSIFTSKFIAEYVTGKKMKKQIVEGKTMFSGKLESYEEE
ncbi:hypothetical protein CMI37_24125 [Candidatus Pacearchaeota archaeon]|nr:hypothetical protein [Candidatus Pacearchaeota archaeon]